MLVIKDFTLGQFYPSNSFVHKLDPRIKIIILLLFMVFVFCAQNFISLIFLFFIIFFAMVFTKVPLGLYFKNLKLILPILLFTMVINLFYTGDGTVLFEWWKLKITTGGISWSLFLSLRVIIRKIRIFILVYSYSHIYHFWCSLFLPGDSCFPLVSFTFTLIIFLCCCCRC